MKLIQNNPFKFYMLLMSALLIFAWLQPGIPLILLFRDTFHLAEIPTYQGLFSNIGSFLYCAAGSITAFSAVLLYSISRNKELKNKEFISFLAVFSILSFFLMFDDFFMFHESIAPNILGISEKSVLVMLGVATISSLVVFRKTILLKTDFKILAMAVILFAASVVFDKILDGHQNTVFLMKIGEKYILEDGSKFLGIAAWLYYFALTAFDQLMYASLNPSSDLTRSLENTQS